MTFKDKTPFENNLLLSQMSLLTQEQHIFEVGLVFK